MAQNEREPTAITERCNGGSTNAVAANTAKAEILLLLGRGHTSSFVADELTVAESTVRSHRKNIYRKLGVSSREELFKLLDDEGDGPDKGV